MSVTVVVTQYPAEGKRAELASLMQTIAKSVLELEEGSVRFQVFEEIDGDKLVLVEEYADQQAFQDHLKTEHMATFLPQIEALVARPLDVVVVNEVTSPAADS